MQVDLVYPEINTVARSTRVRLRFSGPRPPLRPGLYGEARFSLGRRKVLLAPRDALLDTGTQRYVFVDLGEGKFAPRLVSPGVEHQGHIELRSGVAAGEHVVSGAAFLIDSESRLQAAFSGLSAPAAASSAAAKVTPATAATTMSPTRGAPRPGAPSSPSPSSPVVLVLVVLVLAVVLAVVLALVLAVACTESALRVPDAPGEVSEGPGRCSVCGMDLERRP